MRACSKIVKPIGINGLRDNMFLKNTVARQQVSDLVGHGAGIREPNILELRFCTASRIGAGLTQSTHRLVKFAANSADTTDSKVLPECVS